jgi:hypothetical protein
LVLETSLLDIAVMLFLSHILTQPLAQLMLLAQVHLEYQISICLFLFPLVLLDSHHSGVLCRGLYDGFY